MKRCLASGETLKPPTPSFDPAQAETLGGQGQEQTIITNKETSSKLLDEEVINKKSAEELKKKSKGGKKSRHKRPLSTKYYPSFSAFEVNCVPYADAIDLGTRFYLFI